MSEFESLAFAHLNRDGEVQELDQEFFATIKHWRPSLSAEAKKRRVNITLDPDVACRLGAALWSILRDSRLRLAP